MSSRVISYRELEGIHKVSFSHLAKWAAEGVDVRDTRELVKKIWSLRTKPPEWVEAFSKAAEDEDDNTHEGWKKRKTMAEARLKETQLAKAQGDSFDRKDGEAVMASWIAALALAHVEMEAMLPPQLEGLDAAGIQERIKSEFRKVRSQLSDLSSVLWEKVYENYASGNSGYAATPDDAEGGPTGQAAAEPDSEPVVRKARKAGSRSGSEP